jgi:hypothetical protein
VTLRKQGKRAIVRKRDEVKNERQRESKEERVRGRKREKREKAREKGLQVRKRD